MPDRETVSQESAYLQKMALSRWEDEGGAGRSHFDSASDLDPARSHASPLRNAELVQLQIRVIALENLVITLLTGASDLQLDLARAMAAYISPRPGFTAHRLTVHAAAEMLHLIERAGHFKNMPLV